MKTLKQVKADNKEYLSLINAVVKQLGNSDQLGHIRSADDGYSGFTYYTDTHNFCIKNRVMIVKLLEDTAEQLGEDVVNMVCNFGVFRTSPADAQDKKDLYKLLGGGKCEQGTISNVLAWFALEEVNRMFDN